MADPSNGGPTLTKRSTWFVPLLSVLLAGLALALYSPVGMSATGILLGGDADSMTLLLFFPLGGSLVAAPGYLTAVWLMRGRRWNHSPWDRTATRLWLRGSFGVSLVVAVFGVAGGYWMVLFSVVSLPCALAIAWTWVLFEKELHGDRCPSEKPDPAHPRP